MFLPSPVKLTHRPATIFEYPPMSAGRGRLNPVPFLAKSIGEFNCVNSAHCVEAASNLGSQGLIGGDRLWDLDAALARVVVIHRGHRPPLVPKRIGKS